MQYDTYYVDGCEDKDVSRRFLRAILAYSDAFSLIYVKHRQNEKVKSSTVEIKKGLSKFKLSSSTVTEWPGTKVWNEQNYIYQMNIYRVDLSMLPVFEQVESLWDWDYPDYPMDPCFYKDGHAWFTVSTHEHWNKLYLRKSATYPLASDLESLGVSLVFRGKANESDLFCLQGGNTGNT